MITYFGFIVPGRELDSQFWIFTTYNVIFLLGVYKIHRSDPGELPTGRLSKDEFFSKLGNQNVRFCMPCMIVKPERSKHCAACNRCVAKFDHHCPWMLSDVGAKNHRLFVFMALTMVINHLFFLRICYNVMLGAPSSTWYWLIFTWYNYAPMVFVTACMHIVFANWHLVQVFQQLQNIANSLTYNESANRSNYSYIIDEHGKYINVYDNGPVNNCSKFILHNQHYYHKALDEVNGQYHQ